MKSLQEDCKALYRELFKGSDTVSAGPQGTAADIMSYLQYSFTDVSAVDPENSLLLLILPIIKDVIEPVHKEKLLKRNFRIDSLTGLIDGAYTTAKEDRYYLTWVNLKADLKDNSNGLIKSKRYFRVDFSEDLKRSNKRDLIHNCVDTLFGFAAAIEMNFPTN